MPSSGESQDFDEVDDSNRGPTASDRVNSDVSFEDTEETPTENDKDFEDAKPQSNKEVIKIVDAHGA